VRLKAQYRAQLTHVSQLCIPLSVINLFLMFQTNKMASAAPDESQATVPTRSVVAHSLAVFNI